jgi:hypothetical protein
MSGSGYRISESLGYMKLQDLKVLKLEAIFLQINYLLCWSVPETGLRRHEVFLLQVNSLECMEYLGSCKGVMSQQKICPFNDPETYLTNTEREYRLRPREA